MYKNKILHIKNSLIAQLHLKAESLVINSVGQRPTKKENINKTANPERA
jgi:hypothetical protein